MAEVPICPLCKQPVHDADPRVSGPVWHMDCATKVQSEIDEEKAHERELLEDDIAEKASDA